MIITIDGPVASGKSTVAEELARRFGYYYLYTGLLYRALAYALVKEFGYTEEQLAEPRKSDIDQLLVDGRIRYVYDAYGPHVYLDAHEITQHLKTAFVDRISSVSSANPYVRRAIAILQKNISNHNNIVADGRDTGTVVFPNAEVKFFLTATVQERARRWQQGQAAQGNNFSLEEAISAVEMRDGRDIRREFSPLKQAEDAILVDNSFLTISETIDHMAAVVARVLSKERVHQAQ